MNANGDSAGEDEAALSGFYTYKNTFDTNAVWVDVPRQREYSVLIDVKILLTVPSVTFFNTTNPYLDPGTPGLDGQIASPHQTLYNQQRDQWNYDQLQDQSMDLSQELHSHGLEALSAAALYSPPEANMMPRGMSNSHDTTFQRASPNHVIENRSASPGTAVPSNSNVNFSLSSTSAMDSPIDPSLISPTANLVSPSGETSIPPQAMSGKELDGEAESEHKVAFVLRHFSESPGSWCVK